MKIAVLGELKVFRDGQEISLPPSKKTRALLAYLAVVDRPQRRERLCEMFWEIPDDPRGALRWSLSKIRQIVGENHVRADRNMVSLQPGLFDCDYRRISGLRPETLEQLSIGDIEAIANAFRGNFLEDLYLPNCPEFEAWRVAHAEEAELLRARALRLLVDRSEPQRALHYAHLLHILSPDDARLKQEIGRLVLASRESVTTPSPESLLARTAAELAESSSMRGELSHDNDAPAAAAAAIGEQTRRPISALAIEMVGSEDSSDEDDPEADLPMFDALIASACKEIETRGGQVTSRNGASIIGIFGAGSVAEDQALQACRAALAIKQVSRGEDTSQVQLCIGLDCGEAVVRQVDLGGAIQFEILGSVVRDARRLAQTLRHSAIACTSRMNYAFEGYFTCRELTEANFAAPSVSGRFYEIIEEKEVASRWALRRAKGLTPLVGRRQEMNILIEAGRRAKAGAGQAVGVVAEAGVGKSRLIHEFLSIESVNGCRIFECGSLETDRSSSFLAVKKLLRVIFQIDDREEAAVAADKVSNHLRALGADGGIRSALLFVLDLPFDDETWNSLPGPKRVRRIRNSVMGLLELMAQQAPLIVVMEDLHWADADSLMVLGRLIDGLRTRRIMLLTSFRPDYHHQWSPKDSFIQLNLSALDPVDTRSLVEAMLGNDPSVSALVPMIAERTEGVPLFAEETVQALAQSGALTGAQGSYIASGAITSLRVPSTVQMVIAARIDRLPSADRRLLQNAAIVGREVSLDLLALIAGRDHGTTAEGLSTLQDAGFLYEGRLLPTQIFVFKHALVHKVAYESIVGADRRKLHAKLIDVMEANLPHLVEEHVEQLCEHAVQAERWEKAEGYFLRSASRALQRSSHHLALGFLHRGLDVLYRRTRTADRDRSEIEYQKLIGVAWMAAKGWGAEEVYTAYDRMEALSEALADESERFTALRGRAQYYMVSGQPRAAQEISQKFQGMKALLTDTGRTIEVHHVHWTNNFFMGKCIEAARHAADAIRLYDPAQHHSLTYQYSGHDPGVCSRCMGGLAAWQQGDLTLAFDRCREALDLAQQLSHPLTTAMAYWGLSYLHIFRHEPQDALKWAELGVTICEEYMMPLLQSQSLFQAGWAIAHLGDHKSGIQQMRRGVDAIRATGAEMGLPYFLALLAEAVASSGDCGSALALLEEATNAAEKSGSYFQMPEVLRIEAEVLIHSKEYDESRVDLILNQAVNIADRQGATVLALRAATSLARLYARRKNEERATAVLAPYASFLATIAGSSEAQAASEFLPADIVARSRGGARLRNKRIR